MTQENRRTLPESTTRRELSKTRADRRVMASFAPTIRRTYRVAEMNARSLE
jgi:hypothetical protein